MEQAKRTNEALLERIRAERIALLSRTASLKALLFNLKDAAEHAKRCEPHVGIKLQATGILEHLIERAAKMLPRKLSGIIRANETLFPSFRLEASLTLAMLHFDTERALTSAVAGVKELEKQLHALDAPIETSER